MDVDYPGTKYILRFEAKVRLAVHNIMQRISTTLVHFHGLCQGTFHKRLFLLSPLPRFRLDDQLERQVAGILVAVDLIESARLISSKPI